MRYKSDVLYNVRMSMSRKEKIIALCALLVLIGSIYFLMQAPPAAAPKNAGTDASVKQLPPPPLTAEMKAVLAKSHGFQVLVSYTDRGFEPATATIKKGETIRFTNNSSDDLWVAATGTSGAVYPGKGNECGQSAFDSCLALKPHEFWEFTFDATGTWGYADNLHKNKTGIVHVK